MTSKTVLITGASGFIAPYVIREFIHNGHEVIAIDKNETTDKIQGVKYLRKDVRDISANDLASVDTVLHFAFLTNIPFSISSPVSTTDENIGMTVRLLSACSSAGVQRFLYPSTASLYGLNKTPWREHMAADPLEPYSFQKLATESLIRMWSKRYGLQTGILRLFQVYSEKPREDGVMAIFFRARAEGKPITITRTEVGCKQNTPSRDFIHLKDVARAFYAAAKCDDLGEHGPIFNIASGKSVEIGEIAKVLGGDILMIPRRGYEVDVHEADLDKTKRVLKWEAEIDFIEWLKEHIKG